MARFEKSPEIPIEPAVELVPAVEEDIMENEINNTEDPKLQK